ncbi:unnamed protein product [Hapterophycus canaliculatus]
MLLRSLPILRMIPRPGRNRFMSSGRPQTFQIGQGGRLVIDAGEAPAVVKVTTQWVDSCNVAISKMPPGRDFDEIRDEGSDLVSTEDVEGLTLQADDALRQVTVRHGRDRVDCEGSYLVEAVVPELFSVDVKVLRGSVCVSKKMKGDCLVQLDEGNINIGTVRGETIRLSTGNGRVDVDELEGNVDITATSDVRARLINGARVKIDAVGDEGPSVTVGAMYSSGAQISSTGNVRVTSCHGRIAVNTAGSSGGVDLGSVNGTAQISAGKGGASVHMDVLEEGTASNIRSDGGDVSISLSPQVDADVDITGRTIELPPSYEGENQLGKAAGRINSAAVEPSRAARYGSRRSGSKDAGGGKIDLVGARGQSLRQYFPNDATTNDVRPGLTVAAHEGSVVVGILSWADNIARKFIAREAAAGSNRGNE